jgi:hypothetical protein
LSDSRRICSPFVSSSTLSAILFSDLWGMQLCVHLSNFVSVEVLTTVTPNRVPSVELVVRFHRYAPETSCILHMVEAVGSAHNSYRGAVDI